MENAPSDAVPRRRSATPWMIGGVVGLAVLLTVAAAGSVLWLALGVFHEQARTAIRADSAIADALGTITDIRFDFAATSAAPGGEEFAYRLEGERASGLLTGRFVTVDADTEDLREGSLRLDDGRVVRIGTALRSVRQSHPE